MTSSPFGAPPAFTPQAQPGQDDDVFAPTSSKAISFSLKDPATNRNVDVEVGTFVSLDVKQVAERVQERDFDNPNVLKTWPDGNPKYAAVVKGTLIADNTGANQDGIGESRSLWASIPSALFKAISDEQVRTGSRIGGGHGGVLHAAYMGRTEHRDASATGEKPKAYAVKYEPHSAPGAFDQAPAQQQAAAPAPQQQAAPPAQPAFQPQAAATQLQQQTAPAQPQQQAAPAQPAAAAPAGASPWDVAPSTPAGTPQGQPPF